MEGTRRPKTLAGRLFVWQTVVLVLVLVALGFALDRILERDALATLNTSMIREARTVQQAIAGRAEGDMQGQVRLLGQAGDVRITVTQTDGVVLADSEAEPSTLENHATRPEIRAALDGRVGIASRTSESTGTEYLYVALPPAGAQIVRVAIPLTEIRHRQASVRWTIAIGLSGAVIAALFGVLLVSRGVSRPLRRMAEVLETSDDTVPVPAGPEELRILADALANMSHRLADEAHTSQQAQLTRDLILSSMEEGVLLAEPGGIVTFTNPSVEHHLGTTPDTVASLMPGPLRDAVGRAGREHVVVPVEADVGAQPRWLKGSAVPVDRDGSVLLVLRDVTEAKRIDEIRRDFVENASHELKTPAASIRAGAETIRTADDPLVVARFAEQLEREAIRLSRIVSDLLDLSRLESGAETGEAEPMEPVVVDEVGRWVDEPISIHATTESVSVRASRRDLALLVRNLLDNAVHYTPGDGRVDVTLTRSGGEALLTVEDTGRGIPSRDLPRIFERFYRVDRARSRDTGGTGLGLSIVKHVVENAGGTIEVRSELGRGTEVEVRLPIA